MPLSLVPESVVSFDFLDSVWAKRENCESVQHCSHLVYSCTGWFGRLQFFRTSYVAFSMINRSNVTDYPVLKTPECPKGYPSPRHPRRKAILITCLAGALAVGCAVVVLPQMYAWWVKREMVMMLKADVKKWNDWRVANTERMKTVVIDLSGTSFRGVNLSGADLDHVNFTGADFYSANLSGAKLIKANLTDTNLGLAKFYQANLEGANLSGADLRGAFLYSANLNRALLGGANLRYACLSFTNFHNAKLPNAKLPNANLSSTFSSYTDFIDADLRGVNFSNANLSHAILFGTNLSAANLSHANLSGILKWENLGDLEHTNIHGVLHPPDGFRKFAKSKGAVEIEDTNEWKKFIESSKNKAK